MGNKINYRNIINDNNINYSNYIVTETNIWGQYRFIYNTQTKLRIIKKAELLILDNAASAASASAGANIIIDNQYKKYALIPPKQKGTVREAQTFLLSYASNYSEDDEKKESEFIEKLKKINLSFYKKKCLFQDAYMILIMDTEANLERIIDYMKL